MNRPTNGKLVLPTDFKKTPSGPERLWQVMPALCLDLDGTVRRSKSGQQFISGPSDVELFPGVEAVLWHWRSLGYVILGLSNQGGVAFGHKTPDGYEQEMTAMLRLFERNPFVAIDVCYHHEGGSVFPYNHRSLCRKPGTGMLAHMEETAFASGVVIDWDNSLMVGDRDEDRDCAKSAGLAFQWATEFFGREEEL